MLHILHVMSTTVINHSSRDSNNNSVHIRAMLGVLPEFTARLNDQLNVEGVTSPREQAQIAANLGYTQGHFLLPPDTVLDMMIPAIRELLTKENIEPSEIDAVFSVTLSNDYLSPGNSYIYRDSLNFNSNSLCFDLSANCTGVVNALQIATNLLKAGACKKALIIAGNCDRFSFFCNLNKLENMLCDGGGLILLEQNDSTQEENAPLSFKFKSIGQFIDNRPISCGTGYSLREPDPALLSQIVPRFGAAALTDKYCYTKESKNNSIKENFIFLKAAYQSNELIIECLQELLTDNNMGLSDLSYGICSPWHKVLVEQLNDSLSSIYESNTDSVTQNIARNFFVYLNEELGHITNGQAIVSICHNLDLLPEIKAKPIFMAAAGAGLSVGAAILRLKSTNLYPTFIYEQHRI